jgi:hypothetical protein
VPANSDVGVVRTNPAVLTFDTNDPVRSELVVSADLQTAEETAVRIVGGAAEAVRTVERAADVTADVETGPVVDRSGNVSRSLGVGTSSQISGHCRNRGAQGDQGDGAHQEVLHFLLLQKTILERERVRSVYGVDLDSFCVKCCHPFATAIDNPTRSGLAQRHAYRRLNKS